METTYPVLMKKRKKKSTMVQQLPGKFIPNSVVNFPRDMTEKKAIALYKEALEFIKRIEAYHERRKRR